MHIFLRAILKGQRKQGLPGSSSDLLPPFKSLYVGNIFRMCLPPAILAFATPSFVRKLLENKTDFITEYVCMCLPACLVRTNNSI